MAKENWAPGLFLLAAVLLGIPILLAPFDFWDGRIIDHALTTKEDIGIREWFTTSGWFVQYGIILGARSLGEALHLYPRIILRLIALISLCGVIYEAVRLAVGLARLPLSWSILAGAGVVAYPAWSALLSSVLFIYVFCVWLVLLATRLIYSGRTTQFWIGLPILIISLQLNSNFLFAISLASAYSFGDYCQRRHVSVESFVRFATIVVTTVACFLALRLFFTASGIYEGYNAIELPHSLQDVASLVGRELQFGQLPLLVVVLLIGGHAAISCSSRLGGRVTNGGVGLSLTGRDGEVLWPLLLSAFLMLAATVPYVIVGKSADLRGLEDWKQRHSFLEAVPTAILLASLGRALNRAFELPCRHQAMLPLVLVIACLACAQLLGTWGKLARSAYEAGIITALRRMPPPPPGVVAFTAPDLSGPRFRFYEANWLLRQAYGREAWYSGVTMSARDTIDLPGWLAPGKTKGEIYKTEFIMSQFKPTCRTDLFVSGKPYSVLTVAAWLVGVRLPEQITIAQTAQACPMPALVGSVGNGLR